MTSEERSNTIQQAYKAQHTFSWSKIFCFFSFHDYKDTSNDRFFSRVCTTCGRRQMYMNGHWVDLN